MTPDRIRQIEELYHSARESSASGRAALLALADPELRREVESLLARQDQSLPPLDVQTMIQVQSGTRLGPYQVDTKLGEGGMGEVFRGIDTRLGRAVAIKVVHQQFNARFEREARAISSLNHPHICTLYDIGPNYLVMELLEGETIGARLKGGPIPQAEALGYATQIAAALADAHEHGIVHRDLKPGNIMLTKSGAKVLDFGLATWEGDETLTVSRMVMGTPAYMAPEQREGKPSDARTDIYSFGLVLYEMLTGARATRDRKPLPSKPLEQIVARCLETDPARRWQSTAELVGALEEARTGGTTHTKPSRKWLVAAAAIFAIALIAGYFVFRPSPKPIEKGTIILAGFTNTTGDPAFDGTLLQGLAVELQRSPLLTLVSGERVGQTLELMVRPKESRLTPEIAREICVRTGSAAVVEGSIALLGNQYVLALRAKNCSSGDVLDDDQVVANKKEEVIGSLGTLAAKFRTHIGESLAKMPKTVPLEEATTSSLEALQAFTTGWRLGVVKGALDHYQRAIAFDPQFAMALSSLGINYYNSGQTELAREYSRRAYQLRHRASGPEKLFIEYNLDRNDTGNLEKALATLELWASTYPEDWRPHGLMGGKVAFCTGKYEKGLQENEIATRMAPSNRYSYGGRALINILLGRLPEAEDSLRRAAERKIEDANFLVLRYYIAFLKGDQAGMEHQVRLAEGKQGLGDWMAHHQAMVLAYSGRMPEARVMWQRATDLAQQTNDKERAAIYQTGAALSESHTGDTMAAIKRMKAALGLSKGQDATYGAAYTLAISGDSAGAQQLVDDLNKRFPEDTIVQSIYLPVLRARIALQGNDPRKAMAELEVARPYELAMPGTAFFGFYGGLYPIYVRGEAYLVAHQGAAAAAEFQKLLDHRNIAFADPIGALAHLQLGRAFVMMGDKARARSAYQEFLTLWSHADENVPVLQQAKAEYAKLQF